MTPSELLAIVAVIAVARAVLSLRPVVAGSNGRSTTLAREFLDPFIIAGLAAWVLITFVARTYYIPSGSMLPTLADPRRSAGRQVRIPLSRSPIAATSSSFRRRSRRPTTSSNASSAGRATRCAVRAGTVYVNGSPLTETYVAERPAYDLDVRDYGILRQELRQRLAAARSRSRRTSRRNRRGLRPTASRRIAS